MKYIYYEDIPKKERKELRRMSVKKNFSIRIWNGISVGMAILIANSIASASFPDPNDFAGRLILGILIAVGLAVIFYSAVVDPKIIRAIEKEKNS